MTYNGVNELFDGHKTDISQEITDMLFDMKELANILYERRVSKGSIEFDIDECKIKLDENKKPISIEKYERGISQKLIEEFMLVTNECIAEYFCNKKIPFVFRVHEKPDETKLANLCEVLNLLGVNLINADEPRAKDIAIMLSNVDPDIKAMINTITLRSMMKAFYSPKNMGHYGLALFYYCHFTNNICI